MNKELIAPCGIYCGLCGRYFAFTHNAKGGLRFPIVMAADSEIEGVEGAAYS